MHSARHTFKIQQLSESETQVDKARGITILRNSIRHTVKIHPTTAEKQNDRSTSCIREVTFRLQLRRLKQMQDAPQPEVRGSR